MPLGRPGRAATAAERRAHRPVLGGPAHSCSLGLWLLGASAPLARAPPAPRLLSVPASPSFPRPPLLGTSPDVCHFCLQRFVRTNLLCDLSLVRPAARGVRRALLQRRTPGESTAVPSASFPVPFRTRARSLGRRGCGWSRPWSLTTRLCSSRSFPAFHGRPPSESRPVLVSWPPSPFDSMPESRSPKCSTVSVPSSSELKARISEWKVCSHGVDRNVNKTLSFEARCEVLMATPFLLCPSCPSAEAKPAPGGQKRSISGLARRPPGPRADSEVSL